jgi:hypothetical protein
MKFLIINILFCFTYLHADLSSIDDEINFDINKDNTIEMKLNATGLGLGISPSERLHVQGNTILSGALDFGFQTISSNTTLASNTLIFADTSSDNIVITLPSASQYSGRVYKIKRTSFLNNCYIRSGDQIDHHSRLELDNEEHELAFCELVSNGSKWFTLNKSKLVTPVVSSENLVAWWKFDESSGSTTAIDSSGNEHHGTYTNFSSDDLGLAGKFNKSTYFDTTDDYTLIPSSSQLELQQFTYSFWVKFQTLGNTDVLLAYSTDVKVGFGAILFRKEAGDTIAAFLWDGADYEPRTTASGTVATDIWYHIAVTYDQNNLTVYKDGVATSTARSFTVDYDTTNNLILGNDGNASNSCDAIMDDVRVFNYALSSDEVQSLISH